MHKCWLVVELGTPREQRPGRTVERSRGESERTKRKGRNLHLISFVSNPSINFTSYSFYWLKSNKTCFFMTNHYFSFRPLFLFPKRLCVPKPLRKSSERPKSFLCFGSSRIHVPVRVLLHTLLSLCFGSSLHYLYMTSCTGTEPTAHGMSR